MAVAGGHDKRHWLQLARDIFVGALARVVRQRPMVAEDALADLDSLSGVIVLIDFEPIWILRVESMTLRFRGKSTEDVLIRDHQ